MTSEREKKSVVENLGRGRGQRPSAPPLRAEWVRTMDWNLEMGNAGGRIVGKFVCGGDGRAAGIAGVEVWRCRGEERGGDGIDDSDSGESFSS